MSQNDSQSRDPLAALRTVRDFIRWGASEFNRAGLVFGHGSDNALDDAFHLVLWQLNLSFDLPSVYLETALTDVEREAVIGLLRQRVNTRKPTPYLTGEAWFMGLPFDIDERALIPRSPIGELIEKHFEPWLPQVPETILDLCAGSGCIGIACAYACPDARVDLGEIDQAAIELIRRNLKRHALGDRVQLQAGDLFAAIGNRRYDLIVSNPPYVPTAEWEALAAEFKHEPRRALDAGVDGMDIVDRILREAPAHLTADGVLICEIGGSQEEFDARFPQFPGAWPDFERGGDGVFVIGRADLVEWLRAHGGGEKAQEKSRKRKS